MIKVIIKVHAFYQARTENEPLILVYYPLYFLLLWRWNHHCPAVNCNFSLAVNIKICKYFFSFHGTCVCNNKGHTGGKWCRKLTGIPAAQDYCDDVLGSYQQESPFQVDSGFSKFGSKCGAPPDLDLRLLLSAT